MMVDAWGHIQQQSVYYPFGGERVITNNVANNYKFTGLERDSETGLDHTLNRQYSSTLGRWLSADPVRGCGENPQKFDRYAYVVNNPLSLVDPLGLDEGCTENPDGTIDCPPIQVTSSAPAPGDDTGPGSALWDLALGAGGEAGGGPGLLVYRGGIGPRGGGFRSGGSGGESGKCTERTSDKPIMFNLCADAGKDLVQAWSCEGGPGSRDCCLTKEQAFTRSCENRGKDYSAEVHNSLWGSMEADCCKEPEPKRPKPKPPKPR
jgi:RHS repeat-associated protein